MRIPRGRAVLLALAVITFAVIGVFWRWVDAQARAAVVIFSVLDAPVLSPVTKAMTDEPRVVETVVAGNPASVFEPGGSSGDHPALLFVNGVVREGREMPEVRRLAEGLARAGYLVVVPDLPGLTEDEITPRSASETAEAARAVADRPDARGGKVGLIGASTGAAMALLAAQDPALEGRLTVVAGTSPYSNIRTVVNLATTGHYHDGASLAPYDTDPLLSYVAARSLIAALPPGEDREALRAEMASVDRENLDPLATFRDVDARGLGPQARSVVRLLVNRDPERFASLYDDLPEEVRGDLARLSPLAGGGKITAPVEIASGPEDKYFPVSESRAVSRIAPDHRLTVTESLGHADLGFSPGELADFARLDGFVVRSLRAARG